MCANPILSVIAVTLNHARGSYDALRLQNGLRLSRKGTCMNLGFIESKTYDEISVGDTARTEHVLTTDDAMAFASISRARASKGAFG